MPQNPSPQPAYAPLAPLDGAPLCEATDPGSDRLWTCLAAPGHARDHAAYGASETVPIHTWPQDTPAVIPPNEPDGALKCAATDNGYCCTARNGHPAGTVHAAWGLPVGTELCHTWPQSPPMDTPPLVSEVGTLTPEEMASLTIARDRVLLPPFDNAVSVQLVARLVAIIDRLAGITTTGGA